jgi:hypothetical protein
MSSSRRNSKFKLFRTINIEGNTSERSKLIERHNDIWPGMPSTGNAVIDDALYKRKLQIDILRDRHIKSKYKGNIYDNPNKSVKKALAKYLQNQSMETWFPDYNPYNHQHYRIFEKVMAYGEKNLTDFFRAGDGRSDLYHLGGFDILPGVRPTNNAHLNQLVYEKRKQIERLRVNHMVSGYPGNIADNPDPDVQKDWIQTQIPPTLWFPDYNPGDPIHINIIKKLQEYRDEKLEEFYLVGPQLSTMPEVDGGYKKYKKTHNKKYKKTHNKKYKQSLKIK